MGCDIHSYAEVNTEYGWQAVGRIFKNTDYRPTEISFLDLEEDWTEYEINPRITEHPFKKRNYSLFAMLADVRNRGAIKPIEEPKGLPQDVTEYVKHKSTVYGEDGHSHSWLTLEELQHLHGLKEWAEVGVLEEIIDLRQLKEKNGVLDVRIVFWFDN